MTFTTSVELALEDRRRKERSHRMKRTLLHALADQVYIATFNNEPRETIEGLLADMRLLVEG